MLTNKAQLATKTKSSDHIYQCDPATPLAEVYEALSELRSFAYGRMKEAEEQQKVTDVQPQPES